MQKQVKEWLQATDNLRKLFVKKYFGKDAEWYWTNDCVGDILQVDGYYFDTDDITNFLKYNYTADQLFDYYDYRLNCNQVNESPEKIKNYLKLKK